MIAASTTALMIGKAVFAALGLAVGVQLIRQARQAGGFGLQGLAVASIFVGGMGLIVIPIGESMAGASPGPTIAVTGEILMRTGMAFLAAFVWRVFRPNGIVGACLFAGCVLILSGSIVWDLSSQPRTQPYDDSVPSAHGNQIAIALPFFWAALESMRSWLQARRRHALGLADVAVCRRFLLWGIACASFVGIALLAVLAGEARSSGNVLLAAGFQSARALLYLSISGAIGVAFFRPDWLSAREQPQAG